VRAVDTLRAELLAPLDGVNRAKWLRTKSARLAGFARAKWVFRGCEAGERLCALGLVKVENHGRIVFGDRVTFVGGMIPSSIETHEGGVFRVGNDTSVNYGTRFEVHQSIEIGEHCLFASMIFLCDKLGTKVAPIRIGDNCWIAHGAVIEPGVTVGRGSVVAAGALVTKDVPEDSLALGNPARTMKLSTLDQTR
jgi:maltose O-acetyltransferase